jgi:hypothetical protein
MATSAAVVVDNSFPLTFTPALEQEFSKILSAIFEKTDNETQKVQD